MADSFREDRTYGETPEGKVTVTLVLHRVIEDADEVTRIDVPGAFDSQQEADKAADAFIEANWQK